MDWFRKNEKDIKGWVVFARQMMDLGLVMLLGALPMIIAFNNAPGYLGVN